MNSCATNLCTSIVLAIPFTLNVTKRYPFLLRESFRLNMENILAGYDIIFVARDKASESSYKEIESAMLHLLRKMKLVKKL